MVTDAISLAIRTRRRAVGLTQAALAARASLSLATVQNVEAGRANPSLSTIRRLLDALDLDLTVRSPPDSLWEALVSFGLPLASHRVADRPAGGTAGVEDLADLARRAARACASGTPAAVDARTRESFAAWLLALRGHFPSTYRRWFAGDEAVEALVPREPSGRHIKLSRIARERLAEVL